MKHAHTSKSFIFIVMVSLFILQTTLCFSQFENNKREKRKGYEKLIVFTYNYNKAGKIDEKTREIIMLEEYDPNGYITLKSTALGEFMSLDKYKYDENNHII